MLRSWVSGSNPTRRFDQDCGKIRLHPDFTSHQTRPRALLMDGQYEQPNGHPVVLTGRAHEELAQQICDYVGIPLGRADVFKFRNDNTFVRILQNIRERDVFIVQPTSEPVNDHIMEMLIMIDAALRASAGRITAVVPYFSYARTDKKDQPRVPITGRLIADLLQTAGANRFLAVDLHAGQVQGFFKVPVDELTAMPLLSRHFKDKELKSPVVVSPDIGSSRRARDFAHYMDAPLAIVEKRRTGNEDKVSTLNVIGQVAGCTTILVDDEIATGKTVASAAEGLKEKGAKEIYVAATHAVFPGDAAVQLAEVPYIKEIVITDTMPLPPEKQHPKIKILSVAGLLGEAIIRIHEGRSVGALFNGG